MSEFVTKEKDNAKNAVLPIDMLTNARILFKVKDNGDIVDVQDANDFKITKCDRYIVIEFPDVPGGYYVVIRNSESGEQTIKARGRYSEVVKQITDEYERTQEPELFWVYTYLPKFAKKKDDFFMKLYDFIEDRIKKLKNGTLDYNVIRIKKYGDIVTDRDNFAIEDDDKYVIFEPVRGHIVVVRHFPGWGELGTRWEASGDPDFVASAMEERYQKDGTPLLELLYRLLRVLYP